MVFFSCNACGESLKKSSVEKHYQTKCRNCEVLSCLDCGKDFFGEDYVNHTSCISEDQKYGGKNYTAAPNKGVVKQSTWMETVCEVSQSNSLSPKVRGVLNQIINGGYDNVPRKKAKFLNFMSNSLHMSDSRMGEEIWNALDSYATSARQNAEKNSTSQQKPTVNSTSSSIDESENEKINGEVDNTASQKGRKTGSYNKVGHNYETTQKGVKTEKPKQNARNTDDEDTLEGGGDSRRNKRQGDPAEETIGTDAVADEGQPKKKKKKKKTKRETKAINDEDKPKVDGSKHKRREETAPEDTNAVSEEDENPKQSKKMKLDKQINVNDINSKHSTEDFEGNHRLRKVKSNSGLSGECSEDQRNIKDRKRKKKRNNMRENGSVEDDGQKKKKKRRKNTDDGSDDDTEINCVIHDGTVKKDTNINNLTTDEEEIKPTVGKFPWNKIITKVLEKAGGEIALKKLKKKVLAEYYNHGVDPSISSEQKLWAKFNKKVNHNPDIKVHKEMVKLRN